MFWRPSHPALPTMLSLVGSMLTADQPIDQSQSSEIFPTVILNLHIHKVKMISKILHKFIFKTKKRPSVYKIQWSVGYPAVSWVFIYLLEKSIKYKESKQIKISKTIQSFWTESNGFTTGSIPFGMTLSVLPNTCSVGHVIGVE